MIGKTKQKEIGRKIRHKRIRAKISGTKKCPRLSVFRSNKYIYVQLVDDESGNTIVQSSSQNLKTKEKKNIATMVGQDIAKKAIDKKIKKVVFDRSGYIFTGVIKAVAEGAREGGLVF